MQVTTTFRHMEQSDALKSYAEDKLQLIVNSVHTVGGIEPIEVQESLKKQIAMTLPMDGKTVVNSINQGAPFMLSQPESLIAQKIIAIADKVAPGSSGVSAEVGKAGLRFKLFGR